MEKKAVLESDNRIDLSIDFRQEERHIDVHLRYLREQPSCIHLSLTGKAPS